MFLLTYCEVFEEFTFNRSSQYLLVLAIFFLVLSFIFPIIRIGLIGPLMIFHILSRFGLLFLFITLLCMLQALRRVRQGQSANKWTIGSLLTQSIPLLVIFNFHSTLNVDIQYSIVRFELGFYFLCFSAVGSVLAGLLSHTLVPVATTGNVTRYPVPYVSDYPRNSAPFYQSNLPKSIYRPSKKSERLQSKSKMIKDQHCTYCGIFNKKAIFCVNCGKRLSTTYIDIPKDMNG